MYHAKHYLLHIVSICIVLSGIAFVFSDALKRGGEWYVIYMSNSKTYFGHLVSDTQDKIIISNPYRFDLVKTASSVSPSEIDFVVEPIENWYSITPVSSADAVSLSEQGDIIVDKREVLYWGLLDKNVEITQALVKANADK